MSGANGEVSSETVTSEYSRFRNKRGGGLDPPRQAASDLPRGITLQNVVPRPPQALQDSLEERPPPKCDPLPFITNFW
eukprot:7503838-Pyramimonas_sp.AAC.1